MAQTSYYAKISKPELQGGHTIQFGWAKFTKKAKTASISTQLKIVKGFNYTWRTGALVVDGPKLASGILKTTGTVVNGMVRVSRASLAGALSGGTFWYELIGW